MLQLISALVKRPQVAVRSDNYAEQYRSLLHQVRRKLDRGDDEPVVIGVTSAESGEGVSSVAANVAICGGRDFCSPTLLVDANIRRPSARRTFALRRTIGLTDILRGAATPECIQGTGVENLSVISAGSKADNGAARISARAMQVLTQGLKARYPLIVVDLPSVCDSSDCPEICQILDGVLLVVKAEQTRKHAVVRAKDALAEAGARVLGVVFNERRDHVPGWLYQRI